MGDSTRAVVFDLFETLITQFDPNWSPPTQSWPVLFGIPPSEYARHWNEIGQAWERGEFGSCQEALDRLCTATSVSIGDDLRTEFEANIRRSVHRAFETIEPRIKEMLRDLKEAGVLLGLVTNAHTVDTERWFGCELEPYFDDVVVSHSVGVRKPDAAIFELSCSRLGVEPSETAFIGDGGSDELAGAEMAGMKSYWATWFLEMWPEGIRPNRFVGDNWRQHPGSSAAPFRQLTRPADLLGTVLGQH